MRVRARTQWRGQVACVVGRGAFVFPASLACDGLLPGFLRLLGGLIFAYDGLFCGRHGVVEGVHCGWIAPRGIEMRTGGMGSASLIVTEWLFGKSEIGNCCDRCLE